MVQSSKASFVICYISSVSDKIIHSFDIFDEKHHLLLNMVGYVICVLYIYITLWSKICACSKSTGNNAELLLPFTVIKTAIKTLVFAEFLCIINDPHCQCGK